MTLRQLFWLAEGRRISLVQAAQLAGGSWSASQVARFVAFGVLDDGAVKIPYDPRVMQSLASC